MFDKQLLLQHIENRERTIEEQNKLAATALGALMSMGAGGCVGGKCPEPTPGSPTPTSIDMRGMRGAEEGRRAAEEGRDQPRVNKALEMIRGQRYGGEQYDPATHGAPQIQNYKLPHHLGDHDYDQFKRDREAHQEHMNK